MTEITLQKAKLLTGIEEWILQRPQEIYLIKFVQRLIDKNGDEWIRKNQGRLQEELEILFKEVC